MKKRKINVDHPFFKIVGDGGISSVDIGEGRFIPALIIDIENHIEVAELIKLHVESPSGDTELSWGFPDTFFKPKSVYLKLDFIRPMKISFGIEFLLEKHSALVDGIIQSKGFRLQVGKTGDRISEFKTDSILIEVPSMGFESKWNEVLNETLLNKYKRLGVPRQDRDKLLKEHIASMRQIWNFRREID